MEGRLEVSQRHFSFSRSYVCYYLCLRELNLSFTLHSSVSLPAPCWTGWQSACTGIQAHTYTREHMHTQACKFKRSHMHTKTIHTQAHAKHTYTNAHTHKQIQTCHILNAPLEKKTINPTYWAYCVLNTLFTLVTPFLCQLSFSSSHPPPLPFPSSFYPHASPSSLTSF